MNELGPEKLMFEAADPKVFAWYVKNYGLEVNLFVDHSQIVKLECLRAGIWGNKSLWGAWEVSNPKIETPKHAQRLYRAIIENRCLRQVAVGYLCAHSEF